MFPNFLNMLSWWQWAILAAVPPAIVLLYFLKLKRRPVEVPSTYLWHKSTEDLHVNSIWQRLRRNLLLFLQLLIIALAVAALLRPSWQGTKLIGNRFIFLVDNSASMTATDVKQTRPNVKRTRLDEAKEQVAGLIDQMRSGDVAMLISFCDSARVEQSFTDNRQQLHQALDAIQPTARTTSLLEALKLAAGLANPGRSAENFSDVRVAEAMPASLYIFSDGRFGPVAGFALGNLEAKFVPIGSPDARNVGITAFSVRRNESKPDRLQAFARLENFGSETASVPLEMFLDGRLIDADTADVQPKESRGVSFDLESVGSGVLKLKAATDDQLALDDVAYAVVNPPRRSHILLVTTGNEWLRLGLQTKEAAEIADVQIELPGFLKTKAYKDPAAAGGWQLVIYDQCQPERMPAANTLFIGSLPPEGGWSAKARSGAPQIIDVDTAHPLLQWIDMGNVLIGEATPLVVPRGGRVLVDSDAGPLMALGTHDAFQDVVFGFSFTGKADTNFMVRTSFPVFVLNLLDCLAGGSEGLEGGAIRPGTPISFEAAAAVEVRTPTGRTIQTPARLGKAVLNDTGELGVYEVRSAGKTVRRIAVNLFDPAESAIRPDTSPAIKIGDVTVSGERSWESGRLEVWKYLALAGLAVLLLEWYIYVRRVY